MAFRTQKAACGLMFLALPLSAELTFRARHVHLRKGCDGELRLDEQGVSFRELNPKAKRPHAFQWPYEQIQQLSLAPGELRVLTYEDSLWKLGADRSHRFQFRDGTPPSRPAGAQAYVFLRERLDQRLVAALAEPEFRPLWEIPVKLLGRLRGSEGVLAVGADRLVYRTEAREQSRTWRLEDIENVSSSGPFQLTLTTYERARFHYGGLKGFNFQLKRALTERQYNQLWRRLNQAKGLALLRACPEENEAPAGASVENQERIQP